MPTHDYHPRESRFESPIFHDGCAECERQAKQPSAFLDDGRMRDMWRRMVAVEHEGDGVVYLSRADATAGRWCYSVAVMLERHTDIDPWHDLDALTFRVPFGGR